ncbi:sensor histidine kinase [Limisalsivibrio acetivorans]|uniref:sensor histidine kinase n=1 Tax=Limisalsivibrio acetivorans TaxID=1304888 RepID=UPI0003B44B4F|nr:ATP-binding protein [Limisalsivibrio acetivorans]
MKLTFKLVFSITAVTAAVTILSLALIRNSNRNLLMEQAHIQAQTLFEMVVITRQWVAENRDDVRPVPAVVTKVLSEYADVMSDFRFGITSTELINPDNAPDEFEIRALSELKSGLREYEEIVEEDGKSYYRYMAPLYVNKACMECHVYQGYQVGDLRGGISITVPLEDIKKTINKSNTYFYIVGFLTFLGVLATVIILLRKLVLENIKKLTDAATGYKSGDFNINADVKSRDEIRELADAFNLMRESILMNEENLKRRLKDVTGKYVLLVEQLKENNEVLRTMNSFKTEIIDSVSHEIRTPLTKIMSYSEILEQPELEDNEELKKKSVETIRRNARLLNMLVNEVITLSRLEHKQHEYHFIPVNITRMAGNVLEIFEQEIREKELDVKLNMPEDMYISVDGDMFRHVVMNLISNAVKFNKQNGEIILTLNSTTEHICFVCRDSGAGIPADEIDMVTQRFYRAMNSKRDFPGSGLGLSIVARIIEGHGGRIEIDSELGKFTEFRIFIPKSL